MNGSTRYELHYHDWRGAACVDYHDTWDAATATFKSLAARGRGVELRFQGQRLAIIHPPAPRVLTGEPLPFLYHDGGRAAAGFKGQASDCVVRAIAIASTDRPALALSSGEPYKTIYDTLGWMAKQQKVAARPGTRKARARSTSPREGVPRSVYEPYLLNKGWRWVPTMGIGTGCTTHLCSGELPSTGVLIVRLSHHVACVRDGRLFDTHDCSRGGTRCVYGYFTQEVAA